MEVPDGGSFEATGTDKGGSDPTGSAHQSTPAQGSSATQDEPKNRLPQTDAQVARWVLGLGGLVAIQTSYGKRHEISQTSELPDGEFRLITVDASGIVHVNDHEMWRFSHLKKLQILKLDRCPISDTGLVFLESVSYTHLTLPTKA